MKRKIRLLWASIGFICLLLAVAAILTDNAGIKRVHITTSRGIPVTVTHQLGISPETRPLVLIGHGFAGSRSIMNAFARTLAHAGYVSATWDFDGHGTNARAWEWEGLVSNAEEVLIELESRQLGDPKRIAILGHSMGSGVALDFGIKNPQTWVTIAISPVNRAVTPQLPHNLLLMAGSLEAPFIRNAQALLTLAGGEKEESIEGRNRKLVVISGVEHVSILFSNRAHLEARQWLDKAFGPQSGRQTVPDRGILWYGLGVLGTILLIAAVAPLVVEHDDFQSDDRTRIPVWRILLALLGGSLGATILLWLASRLGLELSSLLGILVGGYLLIWFGLAGFIAYLISGVRIRLPGLNALLGGTLVFTGLWLGVGLLGQFVWLQWLLILSRLILWPLGFLLCIPWFFSLAEGVSHARPGGKIGWWLSSSASLLGGLFLAVNINPELGFLTIILPIFPIILGLHALASGSIRSVWAISLSGAAFVSWMVLSVFPLQ